MGDKVRGALRAKWARGHPRGSAAFQSQASIERALCLEAEQPKGGI